MSFRVLNTDREEKQLIKNEMLMQGKVKKCSSGCAAQPKSKMENIHKDE